MIKRMNKNVLLQYSFIAASALLLMTSCNKNRNNDAEDETNTEKQSVQAKGGMKIAYVEVDSLMSQYNFCKDFNEILNKKSNNIRATLNNKARTLQTAAAQFQAKVQQNAYTREQAEQVQASLAKQQQDLQALNDRLTQEFEAEQMKYNKEMRDSIQNFLKQYNKTKKYDLILSKAGDNLLLANPIYDITKDVVSGLNKRYKAKK
jgi:outer membrane protein